MFGGITFAGRRFSVDLHGPAATRDAPGIGPGANGMDASVALAQGRPAVDQHIVGTLHPWTQRRRKGRTQIRAVKAFEARCQIPETGRVFFP